MAELDDAAELLFFDTFSHEVNSDINLDLVQFPKPVYITQVRIIPLGARVQADFPGGVRLGATNPSKFGIEFFVNDLGMPGASTFENLGSLEYNQNDCIHLECHHEKIPTDGLVLRGWYSTITLAVYGTLTNATVADQIASPPREPSEPPVPEEVCLIREEEPVKLEKPDWRPEGIPFEAAAMEVEQFELVQSPSVGGFQEPDDGGVYKTDVRLRKASHSSERSGPSRIRTHSESNERDGYVRQKAREWSRSPEYRHSGRRTRSSGGDASHKWPRTPPLDSPIRPRSPDALENDDYKAKLPVDPQPIPEEEEEQFEPILSDDEILGDDDDAQEMEDDIDLEAATFERAIKEHDPFKMPLNRFQMNMMDLYNKDLENLSGTLSKLNSQTRIGGVADFQLSTVDEKESLVHISEQLINHLTHIHLSYRRRNFILHSFFHDQQENLQTIGQLLRIALNFECACLQPQPAFKIRHIKIGVRLIELLAPSKDLLSHLLVVEKLDPFAQLFVLYQQEYMALSIKLMLLKAVYALLDTKEGVRLFINNGKVNGYQYLLTNLLQTPLTRTKFALKSIVKKMNLYEALDTIREAVTKQFVLSDYFAEQHYNDLDCAMSEVISALSTDVLSYHQPKRILPVSKKFEIVYDPSAVKSWGSMIQSYFTAHSLCESILLILSNRSSVPSAVVTKTMELMEAMLKTHVGIDYFVDDCFEATQALVNCALEDPQGLESDDPTEEDELEDDESKKTEITELTQLQRLGLELAFKVQTRYHIDALIYTPTVPEEANFLATHLHELYSQTCTSRGRVHTVETIGLNNYLDPIIKLIEKERRQQSSPGAKYKSPVLSYAVDMVDCCVRHCDNLDYLIEHGTTILELAKNHENFEPSVSAVLQEMYVYLKPLEAINIFAYDDITPLVEVITRSLEYITTFPGDLIMGLRILRHLCIGGGRTVASAETKELKHRFVALQFYSADGVLTLLHILEKLCQYFEQPGLHAPALMTIQGIHCCQIVLPSLQVMREMLTFGIQCRDIEYKDLTPIEHLMKTYFLMHYIPNTSQAFEEAQKIKSEIIKILLAYTQPNEEDEDSLHKSLWTQMIREVVKAILSGPSTFIPGLQVLAELLPLPLPLPITGQLKDSQMQRLLTERKLWSAHLHPESDRLAQMIATICPTSFPQLSDLLTRVCLQLADLAPNMTLLVSKTLTDMLCTEGPIGIGLARLLQFFGQLTSYASVKSSALSILSGKVWELFHAVLSTTENVSEQTAKCQVSVHRILENFFDSEISLISPYSTSLPELNLASALPPRELIPKIIDAILTNLMNADVTGTVTVVASRNLIILTEHDITFYHLRQALMSKRTEFQSWLNKVIELNETSAFHGLLETIVLLVRALTHIDTTTSDTTIPNRTLKLSTVELSNLIGYKKDSDEPHVLKRIKGILEKVEAPSESLMADIENNSIKLETYEASESDTSSPESINEPHLPQTEGIVTQYAARPIYTVYESTDDTQLRVQYWLDPLRIDTLTKEDLVLCERVTTDIAELVSTCLPTETNLSSDCKRVLHLSASPQSNRERTPTAPCFRTRRVEVEPTTGRPEKKIYITPVRGRGFARAPPSRGDLFRSRPPNTSRPPSLHVDDFLALETCGAQPTGPTGYNKIPSLMRGSRVGRNRGSRISNAGSGPYRKSKPHRTASPSPWDASLAPPPPQHFRTATSEPVVTPHFSSDPHYSQSHFGGQRSRGRGRIRTYLR